MSQTGWISIHRKITEHWLWEEKPFTRGQAWIDLLLMVNHKEQKMLLGNHVITVERGEKITSIRKLCERWGWSNTKVRNFLELLQQEQMIAYKSDTKKTVIKVLNYNDYQQLQNEENITKTSQKHHKNITKTSQKHTNNNDNNENNDNKYNNYRPNSENPDSVPVDNSVKFNENSMPYKAAAYLRKLILQNHPRQPVPDENPKDMEKWSLEMDRLHRLGPPGGSKGYTWNEIVQLIEWCQNNSFWQSNILSASKFREKITTLEAQMKRGRGKNEKTSTVDWERIKEFKRSEYR